MNWDGDSSIETEHVTVNLTDLDGCEAGATDELLVGYDDWDNIVYINRNHGDWRDGISVDDYRLQFIKRFELLEMKLMTLEPSDFKSYSTVDVSGTVKKHYIKILQTLKPLILINQAGVVQNSLNVMKTSFDNEVGGSIVKGSIKPSYQVQIIPHIDIIQSKSKVTTTDIDNLINITNNLPNDAFEKISPGDPIQSKPDVEAKKNYKKLLERGKTFVSVGQEDAARLQLIQLNETLSNDLTVSSFNSFSNQINSMESSLEISTESVPTNFHPDDEFLTNSIFIKGKMSCWDDNSCYEPFVNWLPLDAGGAELTFFNTDTIRTHTITIENPIILIRPI